LEAKTPFRLDITLAVGGLATVDLTSYKLAEVPKVDQIITVTGSGDATAMTFPVVTASSRTCLTVSGKETKGTLLSSAGPMVQCTTNDKVSVWITPKQDQLQNVEFPIWVQVVPSDPKVLLPTRVAFEPLELNIVLPICVLVEPSEWYVLFPIRVEFDPPEPNVVLPIWLYEEPSDP
jgi:hypothetical protein